MEFKHKNGKNSLTSKIKDETESTDVLREKILQGKTLQIYWYILTHHNAGVRKIQKALNYSSPGTVSYQIDKLLDAGLISKNDKDGSYYINKEFKKGFLGFFIHIGFLMIPRFAIYLIIYILAFSGYFFFASFYGYIFIISPGGLFLLIFLVFGIGVFLFETIKIWKRRPTKLR
ncbi:MAG: hypothetical protein ACFE96_10245 [Candidatus Hermodarchaeota archaeon]